MNFHIHSLSWFYSVHNLTLGPFFTRVLNVLPPPIYAFILFRLSVHDVTLQPSPLLIKSASLIVSKEFPLS